MKEKFLNNINKMHPLNAESFYKTIRQHQLGHAYLFYGYEGIGKEAFAIELATHLLCEEGPIDKCGRCTSCIQMNKLWQPDFHYVFPLPAKTKIKENTISGALQKKAHNPFVGINKQGDNDFIGIETIRDLKNKLYSHPQQGDKIVVVIQDIDKMRVEGANALLKVLEEPPPYAYFFLITSKVSRILPTILSRCQLINFEKPDITNVVETTKKYISESQLSIFEKSLRFTDINLKKTFFSLNEEYIDIKNRSIKLLKHYLQSDWPKVHKELLSITNEKDKTKLQLFLEYLTINFLDVNYSILNEKQLIKTEEIVDLLNENSIDVKRKNNIYEAIETLIKFKDKTESIYNFNPQLLIEKMFHELKESAVNYL